ncbi:FUSC family protein [Photobacterium sp. J15]|uniref:FUSC family protein n=1 Tax=Photobacterium sp. J15 TaxID=265901 RepID=UPI0007E37914|nr:FUSC family protein [Photobacterium sp. J15]
MFFSDRFIIRHQAIFHLARIVIACAIALLILHIFSIPHGSWALITIIVVMGPVSYLGSVLTKANQRLLGTLVGASLGFTLYLLPMNLSVFHDAILLIFIAVAMYFAHGRHSYAAILVGITLVLVAGTGPGDLEVAEWRTLNVILGTVINYACGRLFFPSRAMVHFQMLVSEFLQLSSDYYLLHSQELASDDEHMEYNMKLLSVNLAKQRSLMVHVQKEWHGDKQEIADIVISERRVLSILENLINSRWETVTKLHQNTTGRELLAANETLFETINQLSLEVDTGEVKQVLSQDIELNLTLSPPETQHVPTDFSDQNINQFGYLWLNHQLVQYLSALSFCLSKVFNHSLDKAK